MMKDCTTFQRAEHGSILIFLAIAVVAIIGAVALSIDLTTVSASQEQAQQNAQLVALSALERYFDTEGSEEVKLAAALARANQVSTFNLTLNLHNKVARALDTTGTDPETPQLIPGRYFFQAPADNSNPCNGGESPPCFVDNSALAPGTNAFRVSGKLYDDIRHSFARVFSNDAPSPIRVNAISTVVPRRGVFVVDISSSLTRETHEDGQYQYAYEVGDPVDDAAWTNNPNFVGKEVRPVGHPTDPKEHFRSDYQLTPAITTIGDADYAARSRDANNRLVHPVPTDFAGNPGTGAEQTYSVTPRQFRIDMFADANYSGPQPLTAVLRGIRSAARHFRQRAVAGDQMGLVFYDTKITWPRVTLLTEDFDYIEKLTDIDVRDNPERGLLFGLRHGLFPKRGAYTNTILGLVEATKLFKQNREVIGDITPTSDFVVIFGDGLVNCASCAYNPGQYNKNLDANQDGIYDWRDFQTVQSCGGKPASYAGCAGADIDRDGQVTQNDWNQIFYNGEGPVPGLDDGDGNPNTGYNCNTNPCSDVYEYYSGAMGRIVSMASQAFRPANIPINVVLTGSHVGPHSVDAVNPKTGKCFTDSEIRALSINTWDTGYGNTQPVNKDGQFILWNDPARGTWWGNASADNPYYPANTDWFRVAYMTGGIWAPIRPVNPAECGGGRLDAGDELCNPSVKCGGAGNCYCDSKIGGGSSCGRRLFDPLCRTQDEQMQDAIEEIMRLNPYTIVYNSPLPSSP